MLRWTRLLPSLPNPITVDRVVLQLVLVDLSPADLDQDHQDPQQLQQLEGAGVRLFQAAAAPPQGGFDTYLPHSPRDFIICTT